MKNKKKDIFEYLTETEETEFGFKFRNKTKEIKYKNFSKKRRIVIKIKELNFDLSKLGNNY